MSRLLLRGGTVVDVRTGATRPGTDVLVEDGSVTAVGPALPADGAEVVEAAGRWVVPGFNDMHAHPLETPHPSGALRLMLGYGVTGYRQMSGSADLLRRRRDGLLTSPDDEPALLALPGALLTPLNAATPDAVRATVREQVEQGADFVKMGQVEADVYPAAQQEANRLGIAFGGHLPTLTDARDAAAAGIRFVEHLGPGLGVLANCSSHEADVRARLAAIPARVMPTVRLPFAERIFGLLLRRIVVNPSLRTGPETAAVMARAIESFDEARAREIAAVFVEHQTWQCPTLIREKTNECGDDPGWPEQPELRYVSRRTLARWRGTAARYRALPAPTITVLHALYRAQLRLTGILAAEGVPMITGSDVSGSSWEVPGHSLHQEFDELARAGVAPLRVLQMTTVEAGRFLRREAFGVVEPGAPADLVLLDADPTTDVAALHGVRGVVRAGRLHTEADLDATRDRVAAGRSVS